MEQPAFTELLAAVRREDPDAIREFVRRYEPYLRVVVRLRLTDDRLRRVFDSMDICQSVLADFFLRGRANADVLRTPERLQALLAKMVHDKVVDKVRKEQHHGGGLPESWDAADSGPTQSELAVRADLVQAIRNRLTEKDRRLLDAHNTGRTWEAVAAEFGGTAAGLRIHLSRAIKRIQQELLREETRHVS